MIETRGTRIFLRVWVVLVLLFLFVPIALIFLYAFDKSTVQSWPISGFTVRWFSVAWHDPDVRQAFLLSIKVGLLATAIALVLGSMVAYAVHQFAFFGRETVSFLLVLPLALPGIITGSLLSFARGLGEFGATITFVSNIPGETETLPLAIYAFTQVPGGDASALRLSIIAVILSVVALVLSEWLTRRFATPDVHDRR